MAYRNTDQMGNVNDTVNDVRSNVIQLLSKVYQRLCINGSDQNMSFENYKLFFQSGVLTITGCADSVLVSGPRFIDVHLGEKISSYGHVPYEWLKFLAA